MEPRDLRIVIIDDNPDAAATLAKLLEVSGFSVVAQIRDTPVALDFILQERPHVVMLDIAMPLIDGFTLASRIRDQVFPPPRLIAVTGHGSERDKQKAREIGFDAHFTKPVEWPKLEALLLSYLHDAEPGE
jgi:CheY-like chemotaxis protein